MLRFAMTAAGILLGMLSVVLLVKPFASEIELGTLMLRFEVYAVLLLAIFITVDHSDKDVTGASFALAPFAGPSAAGMVGSTFLSLFGIPVFFLIATAVWFKVMTSIFRVIGTCREFRGEAIVWQLSCTARLTFYGTTIAWLAVAANHALFIGAPSPGVF